MALRDLPVLGSQVGAPPKPAKGAERKQKRLARNRQAQAFRAAVRQRDGYRCRLCGRRVRRTLDMLADDACHVHHIRGRNVAPEDRFNPAAALTLCGACHRKEHRQCTTT